MSPFHLRRPGAFALAAATATALIVAAACSQPSGAQSPPAPPPPRLITVSANGEIRIAPDIATITAGVISQAPSASAAVSANTAAMERLLAAVREAGIAEKDVQTSGFSVQPQYPPYNDQQPQPPVIVGYQVSNQVTLIVRDLAKIGAALDAFVKAGANNIQGVSFGLADPAKAESEAREKAVRAAAAKAQTIASAAGVALGPVMSVTEGGGFVPMPAAYAMERAVAAAPVPVAPGELAIAVSVTASYEIR